MSGDAQMNVLQPHKWPAIADSGFWQGYYQQAIFHLLTHLLPHHPLPSSKCCCCCCCGGDCSLYVGADEILRASGELFKREDYESSFLARCWRVWIDMSPPQPQPFLSFFFFFFAFAPPETTDPLNRSPDTWAGGRGSLDSQMYCPPWNTVDEKASRNKTGLFISVCVFERARDTEGSNSDWPHPREQMAHSMTAKTVLLFLWFCLGAGV